MTRLNCSAAALLALTLGWGCARQPEPTPAPKASAWDLDWADGSVFYEVFVRSFADSDGDGIGDLRGLIGRLDYLNDGNPDTTSDLGVEGIWLMPVFVSPSYHGYDTTDYENINPDYGTNEDFAELIKQAHARGIHVVVDLMINHTGSDHPWFLDSASSPDSAKRDWYVWRQDNPGWTQPWGDQSWPTWHEKNGAFYYGIFWAGMPDLNFRNPEVRDAVKSIAELWLDRGVDGFRLDAARHITANGPGEAQNDTPETHAFWREFAGFVREHHPNALLVGESWTGTRQIARYLGSTATVRRGDELPMTFNFPLADAILDAVSSRNASPIWVVLDEMRQLYPDGTLDGTFLTNHDMVRVASILGNDPQQLQSAAAILLTLPGTPFIYYGEELGMDNGPRDEGDPAKRTPMAWDASASGGFTTGKPWHDLAPGCDRTNVEDESKTADSLLARYRQLIHLRSLHPTLRNGRTEQLRENCPAEALAFLRHSPSEQVLVVHNLSDAAITAGPFSIPAHEAHLLFASDDGARVETADGFVATLPPSASGVWRLE